ncbi:hypothetical protein PZB74_10500 [Porifericola rhodea]|uniref:hypothetical protein n=1 Tax=Porifericola rhodea TaxID=930972 RepID=UPI0026661AB7|nr:hypothetical protein [Porifericola rhodea]WKN33755.1 hypothetical protein PZB74_10500 [Porifericola rhodea]
MSSFKAFKKLKLNKKIGIVDLYGIYLASRQALGFRVELFAIQDFYIEVWRLTLLPWKPTFYVHTFQKSKKLSPYLDYIDIRSVLPRVSLQK